MYKALISFCSEELDIKQGDILASDFASADVIADLLEAGYIEVYTDPSGGATIEVVTELPETGESNVIYLVPKQDTSTDNIFDEYLWVNNDWELIGSTGIDLSDYIPMYIIENNTYTNPFVIQNCKLGIYNFGKNSTIYYKPFTTMAVSQAFTMYNGYWIITNSNVVIFILSIGK